MYPSPCPFARWLIAFLLLVTIVLTGCGGEPSSERLPGVPLSAELRGAVEASIRSLEAGDRGDSAVKLDLDRYHGLQEALYRPERRALAEDSLFGLWRADLSHVLWPDLAAFNWYLFRNPSDFDAMFAREDFPDSSTATGLFLREWQKLKSAAGGEDFRPAWAARDELDPFPRAWLTLRMSWQERQQGRADEAARLALELLPTARELGGWRLELEVWLAAARALRVGDHLDDALHAATMAEDLADAVARETGSDYLVPFARLERAEVLGARREAQPALDLYSACLDSALARGLPTLAEICLNYAGIFTGGSGNYEVGLGFYRRALALSLADQDSLFVPRHLTNIARRHRLLGDLDSCRVYLEEAGRWIDAYPDPSNRVFFPLIQAEYYAQVGDFTTVDSLLATAASLLPDFSSIEALAELHLQLIEQGTERGRPEQAYRSIALLDSLRNRLKTSSADRNELFDLELATAEFLGRQGLFLRAAEALERAGLGLAERPDPNREWELSRARGDLARRRADFVTAEAAYRACLARSEKGGEAGRPAESRLLLGSVLLDQGRIEAARETIQELLGGFPTEAFGGRFRTRLSAAILGAVIESHDGRFQEALGILDRARASCRPGSPPDLVTRIELETGRAQAGLGRRDQAHDEYRRAMDRLSRAPRDPSSDSRVFLDSDLRRETAEAMLLLATEGTGPVDGAEQVLVGREAESALDGLRRVLPEWQREDPPEIERLLHPQVIYFVGTESSFRWTVANGEVSLRRLRGEADLLAALAPVLADLQQPSRPLIQSELSALAEALGGTPPGWGEAEGGELTIVPDGPLFSVPWGALPLGGGALPGWIDQGPIVLADAPCFREDAMAGARTDPPRLLALGVDGAGRDAGLSSLRHAEREARDVVSLWPAGDAALRVGEAADLRAIGAEELSRYDVIHIASHAVVYPGLADRTTLLLAGCSGDPLTSAEIARLGLRAQLVFLSCCEAAEGIRRGTSPAHAGLARSFLAAGARTVIAPSARIDDEAARRLAGRFYGHWLEGQDVAAALRWAQLDLRDGDPRWAHPYYWALYQAIGEAASPSSPVFGGRGPIRQSEK